MTERDPIKLWPEDDLLDRAAPSGWIHVTTAHGAIALLDAGYVVELSLDYDLGDDELHGTGMTVVTWIAEQQFLHDRILWPHDGLTVHSFGSIAGSGGPRNRTWRCGFGDHRVTDTPVPRGLQILGARGPLVWIDQPHAGRACHAALRGS